MEVITTSWHSYPKIYALGHRQIADLLKDEVIVEEKVDGSQFSFGVFEEDGERKIRCRSKGVELNVDYPEKMFIKAVEAVKGLSWNLNVGWTYRAEYLSTPKHNTLQYGRVPTEHLIVFDINRAHEDYLSYDEKEAESKRIGLEVVPLIYRGMLSDIEQFRSFLDRESILGEAKIEGVVIKNYSRFVDGKAMIGKFVSESFTELHQGEWRTSNSNKSDVIVLLTNQVGTPQRWDKAVQHLKESGKLEGTPKDIGAILKECQADIEAECLEHIQDSLIKWALPQVLRGAVKGIPQWYKEKLAKAQFSNVENKN